MQNQFMQNAPYRFYYLRSHRVADLIKDFLGQADKEDEHAIIQQTGEELYQFRVQDKYSQWTVLKTWKQFVDLMQRQANEKLSYFQMEIKVDVDRQQLQRGEFELSDLRINEDSPEIPKHVRKFFEIYNTNIRKITSFCMYKKVRGLTRLKRVQNFICGAEWEPKRIIITSQGVLQMASEDNVVTDFLKFDLYFTIQSGMSLTGQQFGIALFSAQRKVVLRAQNVKQFIEFLFYAVPASNLHKKHVNYAGSCQPKLGNNISFLVDAENYYVQVALALEQAQKTVFICGWWISPQLYLVRPVNPETKDQNNYRLDNLLKRIASRGVKIYIVVFFSPSVIPNDSDHTKKALAKLHPNITVQRHPHQFLPKLWSHHEKAVIIDQKIAFMGGLDLCYGRYDTHSHPVNKNDPVMYPGIDYNNVRIKDFIQVSNYNIDLQQRNLPRMPWHDVAFKVVGKVVADVANHFIQYWNFTLLEKSMRPIISSNQGQFQQTKQIIEPNQSENAAKLALAILKMAVEGNSNYTKKEKERIIEHIQNKDKEQKHRKKFRLERFRNKFEVNNGPGRHCLILSIESLKLLKKQNKINEKEKKILNDELQLLRSASQWSIGLENGVTERSIQNAYIKLIKQAKSFVYIQNQFFISATGDSEKSFVQNQIANALFQRIKKAIQKKQKFKVVVFMPLLPGMEGELNQKCPFSLKLTMFWQFNTISQSKESLISRVKGLTDRPEDYIEFFSLRSHGILQSEPVTEIIYIHTKLMIVDDNIVLCGSANINDRSQEGSRDSQLAILFTNGDKVKKKTNGTVCNVNQKAYNLRKKLMREHFNIAENLLEDPLSQELMSRMREIAQVNTETYRELFGCCPDDQVGKLSEVKSFEKKTTIEKYNSLKDRIIGHAVIFPGMFLSEEKLYKFDVDMIQDIFT